MPGAEIGNIVGNWIEGQLHIQDTQGQDLVVFNSTGIGYGGQFGGYLAQTTTVATALTITAAHLGKRIQTATDDIVFTLPVASTSKAGYTYTIMNTGSAGAAKIVVVTADIAEYIVGNGAISTDVNCAITNTKATAKYGDYVKLVNSGAVIWSLKEVVGTWAGSVGS